MGHWGTRLLGCEVCRTKCDPIYNIEFFKFGHTQSWSGRLYLCSKNRPPRRSHFTPMLEQGCIVKCDPIWNIVSHKFGHTPMCNKNFTGIQKTERYVCWTCKQEILKGEVSLYHWPPVSLVWNQLYDNRQFMFLFANSVTQFETMSVKNMVTPKSVYSTQTFQCSP
jgi:hypothetical protein